MDESVLDGPWREGFELVWETFCPGAPQWTGRARDDAVRLIESG